MSLSAQSEASDRYRGTWKGIITQNSGATIRYFDMSMVVASEMDSDSIFSISSHVMDGDYHAYMDGLGYLRDDGKLYINEREIIRADSIPGMEWCVKDLMLDYRLEEDSVHLRGKWGGDTSFGACEPGDIDLVQAIIRP